MLNERPRPRETVIPPCSVLGPELDVQGGCQTALENSPGDWIWSFRNGLFVSGSIVV